MTDQEFRDVLMEYMGGSREQLKSLDNHVMEIKDNLEKGNRRMDEMDERMDGFDAQVTFLRGAWAAIGFIFAFILAWFKGNGK